ncbi:hypothetical protein TNCV_2464701 [Trichonephila clavipes]|nr:hypothetical protein TNCV_2464701 [Trichonephila clavipes]
MDSSVLQLTQIVSQDSSQQISARTMSRDFQRITVQSREPVKKLLISAWNAKFVCSGVDYDYFYAARIVLYPVIEEHNCG